MKLKIGWVPIPTQFINRPPPKSALSAWMGLWAHFDRRVEPLRAYPSTARLAMLAECDERSIRRGLDWLVGNNMIRRVQIRPGLMGWECLWTMHSQTLEDTPERTKKSAPDKIADVSDKKVHIKKVIELRNSHTQRARACEGEKLGVLDRLDLIESTLRARHGEHWPRGQSLTATGIFESLRVLERANVKRPAEIGIEDAAITFDESFHDWTDEQLINAVQDYVGTKGFWPFPSEIKQFRV
tara:strand:+ start:180 stop:902 length:723 start_codon:yes stop_codon:yes gene_type:complete